MACPEKTMGVPAVFAAAGRPASGDHDGFYLETVNLVISRQKSECNLWHAIYQLNLSND